MHLIHCPCGQTKEIADHLARRGQKYCSVPCARRFRVYGKSAPLKDAKLTIPLTQTTRAKLQAQADARALRITDLGRRYIVDAIQRAEDEK